MALDRAKAGVYPWRGVARMAWGREWAQQFLKDALSMESGTVKEQHFQTDGQGMAWGRELASMLPAKAPGKVGSKVTTWGRN